MLTKQDLNSIREVIKDEVRTELIPVRKDISSLKSSVTNLQTGVAQLQKGSQKLSKDLTKAINFFDKADLSTRERVNKTRSELGLHEVTFAY